MGSPPSNPTVSAVIPVHDGEAHLAEAIQSVLAQTAAVLECIVVDDGSSDASAAVARSFGGVVRCLSQPQGGVSIARNRGLREARGDLVAFLDHDDVWCPEKLERQLPGLQRSGASLSITAVELFGQGAGEILRLRDDGDLLAGMLRFTAQIPSLSSTGLGGRAALEALGGFDPALGTSADWDLLLRVLLDGSLHYLDEPLTRYRRHGSNMSRNVAGTERDMRAAFAKAFAHPALPQPERRRRRASYARLFRMLSGSYRDQGRRAAAARTLLIAAAYRPVLAWELVRHPSRLRRREA